MSTLTTATRMKPKRWAIASIIILFLLKREYREPAEFGKIRTLRFSRAKVGWVFNDLANHG